MVIAMSKHAWLIAAAMVGCCPAALLAQGSRTAASSNELRLEDPVITLLNEINVPARDAGVLKAIPADEGDEVAKDSLLAELDDTEVRFKLAGAKAEVTVAKAEAKSEAAIRASEKMADAAKADWDAIRVLHKKGTVSDLEERAKYVAWERSKAQTEVAIVEHETKGLAVFVKQAALDAAQNELTRRKILLTEDWKGIVLERMKSPGEWVQPGDTIMRIARMDRLRVKGYVRADVASPHELRNRTAKVLVPVDQGRQMEIPGKVTFSSPEILTNGRFRVTVEIENTLDDGQWLARPGQFAEVIIPLDRPLPTTVRKVGSR
jgi:macrolide-specific efflux system membrane fusion protein